MTYTLADLGWSAHFARQPSIEELDTRTPARVAEVHRSTLSVLILDGSQTVQTRDSTGDYAVGDWLLLEGAAIDRRLDRSATLDRRAAGEDARR